MPRSSKDYVMGERGVIIIIRGLEEEPAKTPKHMDNKNNNKNTTFLRPRKDRSRKRGVSFAASRATHSKARIQPTQQQRRRNLLGFPPRGQDVLPVADGGQGEAEEDGGDPEEEHDDEGHRVLRVVRHHLRLWLPLGGVVVWSEERYVYSRRGREGGGGQCASKGFAGKLATVLW